MDENGTALLLMVGMMIVLAVVGVFMVRYLRANLQRTREEEAEKKKFLEEFSGTLSSHEVERYKNLPNHEARIEWLQENHPEFIEKMPYSIIEFKTAQCLDIKLLNTHSLWNEAETLQRYLEHCEDISLRSYQEDLDSFASWVESRVQQGFDKEKASIKLWESLTEHNRKRFKQTRKAAERKEILSGATSSTYETDYLYPVMLLSYLGIDSSDGSSDSSYYEGGDFGGDFGGDSGGGDSGGGDGGGGGGGD